MAMLPHSEKLGLLGKKRFSNSMVPGVTAILEGSRWMCSYWFMGPGTHETVHKPPDGLHRKQEYLNL